MAILDLSKSLSIVDDILDKVSGIGIKETSYGELYHLSVKNFLKKKGKNKFNNIWKDAYAESCDT